MNMVRLIKLITILVVCELISTRMTLFAQSDYFKHFVSMPMPDKESLKDLVAQVWITYPHHGISGTLPDNVNGYVAQWERYRDAVIYILENDQELDMHGYIMVYYLKRLSTEAWEADGFPLVTRFLKKTAGRDDLRDARNQALETLFFRASVQQIGKYLRNSGDRKIVQDYLTSIWTQEALEELKAFLKEIESKNTKSEEDYVAIKELLQSIATIEKRLTYATLPRKQIPEEYFLTEGKRQYEEANALVSRCPKWDFQVPPDYRDGADHVIRYWEKYLLGAYYLLENVFHGEMNTVYIECALCPVQTYETTMILKKLLEKCDENPSCSIYCKASLIRCYIYRIAADELNQRFQEYLFEYGNHLFPDLPNRFGSIGNEESLKILKKAQEFWREKNFQPYVDLFEKNIQSVEQRCGLKPAAETSAPETQEKK